MSEYVGSFPVELKAEGMMVSLQHFGGKKTGGKTQSVYFTFLPH